jgi:hypothetical protein
MASPGLSGWLRNGDGRSARLEHALICPTGNQSLQRRFHCRVIFSLSAKILLFTPTGKSKVQLSPSHPPEGRRPSSRTLRWDAVDAEVTKTNVAEADGEVVSFRRPKLASSLVEMISEAMVAIEHVSPGRPRISRKTIAQGRPGVLRWTCMLVCTFLCANRTRDRGCSAHPAFPAPSDFSGREDFLHDPGASRRGVESSCLEAVIARSKATKQSILSLRGEMHRFARNDAEFWIRTTCAAMPAAGAIRAIEHAG